MADTRQETYFDRLITRAQAANPPPLPRETPWWETLKEDPWYLTGAKALLGEREVKELQTGDVEPWIATLAPLLLMGGRGPKGFSETVLPRPRIPVLSREELALPPETAKLLDAVRSYEPPPSPAPLPPSRYQQGDLFNYEALPYAPRPTVSPNFELPPPYSSQHPVQAEDIADFAQKFFADPEKGQGMADAIKAMYEGYSPEMVPKAENMLPLPEGPKPWWDTPEMRQFLKDMHGLSEPPRPLTAQEKWEMQLQKPAQIGPFIPELPPREKPLIPPQPPPGEYPQSNPFDFTQYMQTGGVAGMGIGDPYAMPGPSLEEDYIPILPNHVYVPSGDFGAEDIAPSPDYPPLPPPPERFDSADYVGGANYWYVDPKATQTPPVVNNYYGAVDHLREEALHRAELDNLEKNLLSAIGSSLPPASSSGPEEQVRMLQQWADMQEAARRFDAVERSNRLRQEKQDALTRFGPPMPTDPATLRLLNSPINRDYMKDFFDPENPGI